MTAITNTYFNEVRNHYGTYEAARIIIKKFRGVRIPGSRKHYVTKVRDGRYIIRDDNGQTICTTRNMDI